MWGVKVNQDRLIINRAFYKIFTANHLHEYNDDQIMLKKYIWPIAKKNMVTRFIDGFILKKNLSI
jgi:hypothetical protein